MPLIINPLPTESSNGNIEVMDSNGTCPVRYSGGDGAAPENYCFLGDPGYGKFAAAGSVWDVIGPPAGGRSIKLGASLSSGEIRNIPKDCQTDFVASIKLPKKTNLEGFELPITPVPARVRISCTDSVMLKNEMYMIEEENPPLLVEKRKLTHQRNGIYSTNPWTPAVVPPRLRIDNELVDQLCSIPHLGLLNTYLVKTGGAIPANDIRYYRVTAVTHFGESTPGNEVKYITASDSSTNRIPLEITPVPGAIKYRIYMTQKKADPNPAPWQSQIDIGDYSSGFHLLMEVDHDDLMAASCMIYDDGSRVLQAGTWPNVNGGLCWQADPVAGTITFPKVQQGEINAEIPVKEDIIAMDYMGHEKTWYLVTTTGVYKWDRILTPYSAVKLLNLNGIVDITHQANGELWLLLSDGRFRTIEGVLIGEVLPGKGFCVAFCDGKEYFLKLLANKDIVLYSPNGSRIVQKKLPFPSGEGTQIKGIKSYGPLILVAQDDRTAWRVFHLESGFTISTDSELSWPNTKCVCWGLGGLHLLCYNGAKIRSYKLKPDAYLLGNYTVGTDIGESLKYYAPQKELMPGETWALEFPEVMDNGDFSYDLAGYWIGRKTGTVVNGYYTINFPAQPVDWAFIARQNIKIPKPGRYKFSYTSWVEGDTATDDIVIQGQSGSGFQYVTPLTYTKEATENCFEFIVPNGVHLLNLYIYFNSKATKVTFHLGEMSLQYVYEETIPAGQFLLNRNFADGTGAIPSGWKTMGPGTIISSIIDAEGGVGRAWRVKYQADKGNKWSLAYCEDFFPAVGDKLRYSIKCKIDAPRTAQMQIAYFSQDNKLLKLDTLPMRLTTQLQVFSVQGLVPDNCAYAHIILPIDQNSGMPDPTFIYEQVSVELLPSSELNEISDSSFETGISLATWGNVARVTDTPRTGKYCVKVGPNGEIFKDYTVNQSVACPIHVGCWVKGNLVTNGGRVTLYCEYNDGTNSGPMIVMHFTQGSYNWEKKEHIFTPPKPVTRFYVWFTHLGGVRRSYALIDDVFAYSEAPVPNMTDIDIALISIREISGKTVRVVIQASLKDNSGHYVELRNQELAFTVSPSGKIVKNFATNKKGIATCIMDIPNIPGTYSISVKYGVISDSKNMEISSSYPIGSGPVILPFERPEKTLPQLTKYLLVEVEAPKRKKPFPTCEGRVGSWHVFRPALYNERMQSDFEFQISPSYGQKLQFQDGDDMWWTKDRYTRLANFFYIDDLSDYPDREFTHNLIHEIRPNWFLRDLHNNFAAPFGDGRHYYDRAIPECNEWYTRRGIQWTINSGWDGVYVDDFWGETFENEEEGNMVCNILQYPTKMVRQTAIQKFWEGFRKISNRLGLWLMSNYPYRIPNGNLSYEMAETAWDGYLRETWGYASDDPKTGYPSIEQAKIDIDTIVHWESQDKFGVFLTRGWPHAFQARMYCLAKYLMGKDKLAFLGMCGYINSAGWHEDYAPRFYPEYRLKTGAPLGSYTLDDGIFTRSFERCLVLLNANTTSRMYSLPEGTNWTDLFSHQVNDKITLQPNSGYVFMKGVPMF